MGEQKCSHCKCYVAVWRERGGRSTHLAGLAGMRRYHRGEGNPAQAVRGLLARVCFLPQAGSLAPSAPRRVPGTEPRRAAGQARSCSSSGQQGFANTQRSWVARWKSAVGRAARLEHSRGSRSRISRRVCCSPSATRSAAAGRRPSRHRRSPGHACGSSSRVFYRLHPWHRLSKHGGCYLLPLFCFQHQR